MATWNVDSPQRLTIDAPVGRVEGPLVTGRLNVVGADGPARVEITRVGRRPVVVEHTGDRLVVRTKRVPGWPGVLWWLTQWGRRIRADVSIAVPAHARADLRLVDGDLVVCGLREDTTADVTSGHVTLRGLAGRTRANVVSGGVEALDVTGALTLEATSGDLTLADSSLERVDARTVSGSVTCDLDNLPHSDIHLGTVSGNVTVRVREDSDLAVHLHTVSGRITSAFPELHRDGRPGSRDARGMLGAGAGRLEAGTTSGNIALLARSAPVGGEAGA